MTGVSVYIWRFIVNEVYGKEIINRESESQAEVFVSRVHALQKVRPPARLSAQVSSVPDLLSRVGVAGTDSRRGEIELVEVICDFRF